MTPEQIAAAQKRADELAAHPSRGAANSWRSKPKRERADRPMTPLTADGVAGQEFCPPNVAVIEEAVTTTNTTFERLGALKNTTGYFGHRGWGWAGDWAARSACSLAWPERPVLALLGEGAAMYGIQGLWTAARYKLPVTFVICNNAQYQILKIGAVNMGLEEAGRGRFVGMDITGPEIDFVGLAQSLGVRAERISEPDQLGELVSQSLAGNEPRLFDVQISRKMQLRLEYG